MSGRSGRNRPAANGGPQGVKISYASQLKEREPLFHTYEHLQGLPRGDSALTLLRKIASMVKPIMRKRNWKVQILAEFLPPEQNLLGLNINRGHKICIRLRYHNNPDLFLPMEQVLDTLLHELSHNVWGAHDANFHRLWDELRDEQETLIRKGYTGEGFLTEGKRLGGGPAPPPHEMRRLARASAEKRQAQNKLSKGSGQRLGGTPLHLLGGDVRNIITNQITRRNTINKGCASGRADAVKLSDDASNKTFKTKAEEDDANNKAILEALYDLIEEEEERKLKGTFSAAPTDGGLAWDPTTGLYDPTREAAPTTNGSHRQHPTEDEQMEWAMQESIRANNQPATNSNLFEQARTHDTQLINNYPPPLPLDSKPSPISESQSSRSNSVRSPVSPLSEPPASIHGSIKRKRIPTTPSISETTTTATPALSPIPTQQPPPPTGPQIHHSPNLSPPLIDLSDPFDPTSTPSLQWTCNICTYINPLQFLACDMCAAERPSNIRTADDAPRRVRPAAASSGALAGARAGTASRNSLAALNQPAQDQSLGWICGCCGAWMEHKWWTCSACGKMKESS